MTFIQRGWRDFRLDHPFAVTPDGFETRAHDPWEYKYCICLHYSIILPLILWEIMTSSTLASMFLWAPLWKVPNCGECLHLCLLNLAVFFFSLKECRPFTHYVTVNTILITLCRNSVKVHYVVLTWLRAFHEAEILVSVLASSLPAFRVCILLNLGYTSLFMPINLYKTLYSITVFYIRGLPWLQPISTFNLIWPHIHFHPLLVQF